VKLAAPAAPPIASMIATWMKPSAEGRPALIAASPGRVGHRATGTGPPTRCDQAHSDGPAPTLAAPPGR
jgi:hypothetical protein